MHILQKLGYGFVTVSLVSIFSGCTSMSMYNVAKNITKLKVKIAWDKIEKCSYESPEIKIFNLPKKTKYINVSLRDANVPSWNHGGGTVKYNGSNIIKKGMLKDGYNGPCPPYGSHLYIYSIKTLDSNDTIIGEGESKSLFPL